MRRTQISLKHYWQADFIEVKESLKVDYLSFVSIADFGYIVARHLEKKNYRCGDEYKSRRDEDKKYYKDKHKKYCYIDKQETRDESNEHDDEVVYVTINDESSEDEATALVSCMNKKDTQIIGNGCSHHMTGDKSKFITLNYYDGNSVTFGN